MSRKRSHDKESHKVKKTKVYKIQHQVNQGCEGCANYPAGELGCRHFIERMISKGLPSCNDELNIIYIEEK